MEKSRSPKLILARMWLNSHNALKARVCAGSCVGLTSGWGQNLVSGLGLGLGLG